VRSIAPVAEFQRKVRTLTGNWQLCAWLPAVLVPWRNPVWAAFLCHKILRLLTPFLGAVLLTSLVLTLAEQVGAGATALGVVAATAAVVGLGSRFNPAKTVSNAVQIVGPAARSGRVRIVAGPAPRLVLGGPMSALTALTIPPVTCSRTVTAVTDFRLSHVPSRVYANTMKAYDCAS